MFLRFLFTAATFFSFNFLKFSQLRSTASSYGIKRLFWSCRFLNRCWCSFFRGHLSNFLHRVGNRSCLFTRDGGFNSFSWGGCGGLIRFLHTFLKSADASGTFLCRQTVIGVSNLRLRRLRWRGRSWRCGNRLILWCCRTMRRSRGSLPAHLNLNSPTSGTCRIRPKLASINAAERQPVP